MFLPFLIILFPERPLYFFGDKEVKNHYQTEKPPIIAKPNDPGKIEGCPNREFKPFVL